MVCVDDKHHVYLLGSQDDHVHLTNSAAHGRTYLRTCSGVSMAVSTSSICSSRMKKLRHACSRFAFIAQPIGPKSYSPFTPGNLHIKLNFYEGLKRGVRGSNVLLMCYVIIFGKSCTDIEYQKKHK